MENINSGCVNRKIEFIKGRVLYYTTDKKHNNLLYLESFYSNKKQTMVHVFENLDNQKVHLYEVDFDEKYSVFIDL